MAKLLALRDKFHLSDSTKKVFRNTYVLYALLLVALAGFFLSNIFSLGGGKYSLEQIFYVLKDPSAIQMASIASVNLSVDDFRIIADGAWAFISTIVAGTGLAIAGLATQSLTRNALADASTLGLMQGAILALLVAMSFGWAAYYLKVVAMLIGLGVAALLLFVVVWFNRARTSTMKVILAGLALGVIFRTFGFIVRRSGDSGDNAFLNNISYRYTLGGAETVNRAVGDNQWLTLYISAGLIFASVIVFLFIARGLTLLDLGDERARQLGVHVRAVKATTVLTLLLSVPAAVLIVGNLAFIGLFGTHLARYLFRTRSYVKILFPAILIGVTISLFGLLLANFIPTINSGIWMTIVGAPYLIYVGLRGVKSG